jgi:hypothetical protein
MYGLERSRIIQETPYGKLITTESDPDGNCFFHAYLQSTEAETYSGYSLEKRKKRVHVIRNHIDKELKPIDIYELVDPTSFETIQTVIDKWLKKNGHESIVFHSDKMSIRGYVEEVEKKYPEVIKEEHFIQHIHELIQHYGKEIKRYLLKDGTWMFDTLIPLFSKVMKVDIVFISSSTNKPIQLAFRGGYEHVIIMYHLGNHFESMGILHKDEIIRVFTKDAINKLFGEY